MARKPKNCQGQEDKSIKIEVARLLNVVDRMSSTAAAAQASLLLPQAAQAAEAVR
jgi:hypothetical protein